MASTVFTYSPLLSGPSAAVAKNPGDIVAATPHEPSSVDSRLDQQKATAPHVDLMKPTDKEPGNNNNNSCYFAIGLELGGNKDLLLDHFLDDDVSMGSYTAGSEMTFGPQCSSANQVGGQDVEHLHGGFVLPLDDVQGAFRYVPVHYFSTA